MTFSIIIPTKDRPEDLQNCVGSIIRQTVLPQELIIVDASSDNNSIVNQENIKNIVGDKIKLVYLRSAPAVNKQRNLGADTAQSDIIFFLDDDFILKENYSEKILEVYKIKSDENVAGVQGSMSNYYNETWINRIYKKFFFMTRASKNGKSRFLPSLGYVYIFMPENIIEVQNMSAGLCSYYRKKFNEFKFDETFERCTDLELSWRVTKKYKLYQTPFASGYHNYSQSTHLSKRKENEVYVVHMHKLIKKHLPRRITTWLAYYWSVAGELILNTVKSCKSLNAAPLLGTFEGIKYILTNKVQN